jgi:hypothetical protein
VLLLASSFAIEMAWPEFKLNPALIRPQFGSLPSNAIAGTLYFLPRNGHISPALYRNNGRLHEQMQKYFLLYVNVSFRHQSNFFHLF